MKYPKRRSDTDSPVLRGWCPGVRTPALSGQRVSYISRTPAIFWKILVFQFFIDKYFTYYNKGDAEWRLYNYFVPRHFPAGGPCACDQSLVTKLGKCSKIWRVVIPTASVQNKRCFLLKSWKKMNQKRRTKCKTSKKKHMITSHHLLKLLNWLR